MKKYFFLACAAFLVACSEEDPTYTPDMGRFMIVGDAFTKDTVIYLADSVKYAEKLNQRAFFESSWNNLPGLTYIVKGEASAINITLTMMPSYSDGIVTISCNPKQDEIRFEHLTFPRKNWDGYEVSFKNSIKIKDSTYYDILIFKAPKSDNNKCPFSEFYYSADNGIVKVVSKEGVSLNRITPQKYKEITNKLAEERAVADSIEQVVADSIAKAVADSIEQAITDSTVNAVADSIISSSDKNKDDPDFEKVVKEVTNCVKKAYSSGKISSLKNCEI